MSYLGISSLFLVLLSGFLSGCGSKTSSPKGVSQEVTLTFWHTQVRDNQKALNELVEKFNRTNPYGIKIVAQWQGNYDELFRKTMAAIQAKHPPDIAVAYESMVAEYMRAGVVVPLDPFVKGPEGFSPKDLQDLFPAFLATNRFPQFNYRLLSFPFTKSCLVMYVNLSALKEAGFDRPPRTWEEFRRAVIATTKRGADGRFLRRGLAVNIDASTIDGWIMSRGGRLISPEGRVTLNTPSARRVFETLVELFKRGSAYETQGLDYQTDFAAGRAVMVCTSSTQRVYIRRLVGGKFAWCIAPIPQDNPDKPVTVLYGANIMIFKSTPEREKSAWRFIRWLAEKEQTAFWAMKSSYLPIRKSVAQMPEMQKHWWKEDPQGRQAFEIILSARPEPNVRGWQKVREIIEEALKSAVTGQKTVEEALADAEAEANRVIEENR